MSERCASCGLEIAPAFLACPQCHRLVHAERLAALSQEAERRTREGDVEGARGSWQETLRLLPPAAKQRGRVEAKIEALNESEPAPKDDKKAGLVGRGGALAGAFLLIWKIKPVLAFVLTKGKFLLLGLTKASTFFSMFLALGVYWAAWGFEFAAGLIVSIYIHEIGHVAALSRLGIKASAPLFIPGFGAFVRLKEYPKSPGDDARVGLAGPIWGMTAAALTYGVGVLADKNSFVAIARIAALINLFNLIPIWQLDGARGFRALTRRHRWFVVGALAATWFYVGDGMILLVLIAAAFKTAFDSTAPSDPDRPILFSFVVLVLGLTLMMSIEPNLPTASP